LNQHAPRYGLPTLTCVVIASMIGSGVFTTSGYSLVSLCSPWRVLLAWLIGGLIALCGAVGYGTLARQIPLSGGEYVYLSRRIHPFAGFLAGWVSLTAGFSGAIALAALTFEAYAIPKSLRPDWLIPGSAALTLVLLFGLGHAFLARPVARLQNVIVLTKLLLLSGFLVICSVHWQRHDWHSEPLATEMPALSSFAFVAALATSVMWISLSYQGFNAAVYVASEVNDAARVVPRALLTGTMLVTVIYLLLNTVFLLAAPATELAGQKEVAAIAARAVGGPQLEFMMRLAVVLGALTSVAGMIMTGPRVFSRMADDGLFPAWFRSGPQVVSRTVLLQTAIAAVLVFLSDLEKLIQYLSTTLAISSAITVGTLLWPRGARRKSSDHPETGPDAASVGISPSTAMTLCCALIYCGATLLIAVIMAWNEPADLTAAGITLGSGALLWCLTRTAQ
jgi:basic amino acid/polyamine antiporter, APA family